MDNCPACEAMTEVDGHFDAIFDFLDERFQGHGTAELAFLRMDIHTKLKETLNA